jgi:hypothetical protein
MKWRLGIVLLVDQDVPPVPRFHLRPPLLHLQGEDHVHPPWFRGGEPPSRFRRLCSRRSEPPPGCTWEGRQLRHRGHRCPSSPPPRESQHRLDQASPGSGWKPRADHDLRRHSLDALPAPGPKGQLAYHIQRPPARRTRSHPRFGTQWRRSHRRYPVEFLQPIEKPLRFRLLPSFVPWPASCLPPNSADPKLGDPKTSRCPSDSPSRRGSDGEAKHQADSQARGEEAQAGAAQAHAGPHQSHSFGRPFVLLQPFTLDLAPQKISVFVHHPAGPPLPALLDDERFSNVPIDCHSHIRVASRQHPPICRP